MSILSVNLTGMVAPKTPGETEWHDLQVKLANESRRSSGGSSSHYEMISCFLTSTLYTIGLPVASVNVNNDACPSKQTAGR